MRIDNKNKDILILGEWPIQGLDNTTLAAEVKYPINLTQSGRRFVLSLHYNGSNSFLFANATNIYQFKVKDSEMKKYPFCLRDISKDFIIDYMKKTGLHVKKFSVDYRPINTNEISDIHRFLMKETL